MDSKGRFGDWEADLLIGARHSQALVAINERKSRYALLQRVAGKHAPGVRDVIVEQLKAFARLAHTLTTDNGKEFALHEQIAADLKLNEYFSHPTPHGNSLLLLPRSSFSKRLQHERECIFPGRHIDPKGLRQPLAVQ